MSWFCNSIDTELHFPGLYLKRRSVSQLFCLIFSTSYLNKNTSQKKITNNHLWILDLFWIGLELVCLFVFFFSISVSILMTEKPILSCVEKLMFHSLWAITTLHLLFLLERPFGVLSLWSFSLWNYKRKPRRPYLDDLHCCSSKT